MKKLLVILGLALVFGFACSDKEGKDKEEELNLQSMSGDMFQGLQKSASNVHWVDENTVVFTSKDKKEYPVPERCKRELASKGGSAKNGITVSAYTIFWPDSTVRQNDPCPVSAYILESQTYVYTNIVNDSMKTVAKVQWGMDNDGVFYNDTFIDYNTDYQFVCTRHIKDHPWEGHYEFCHEGERFTEFGDWENWFMGHDRTGYGVFRYLPWF